MIGLMTVFCASLALARIYFVFGAAAMIAYVIAVAALMRDESFKRRLIWGAVAGACSFAIGGTIAARMRGELPVTQFNADSATTMLNTAHYAIPAGGFIGALIGCIYHGIQTSRKERIGDGLETVPEQG